MGTWYKLDVGDGVAAYEPSLKLHQAFMQFALSRSGKIPPGAAVFSIYNLGANIVTWFFSPEVGSLANSFGASPSNKPEPQEGFGLLVGDARAWDEYFPDYIRQQRR